jgi:hypothetical protein
MFLKMGMKLHLLAHCMVARNRKRVYCMHLGVEWPYLDAVEIVVRNESNALVTVYPVGITLTPS